MINYNQVEKFLVYLLRIKTYEDIIEHKNDLALSYFKLMDYMGIDFILEYFSDCGNSEERNAKIKELQDTNKFLEFKLRL